MFFDFVSKSYGKQRFINICSLVVAFFYKKRCKPSVILNIFTMDSEFNLSFTIKVGYQLKKQANKLELGTQHNTAMPFFQLTQRILNNMEYDNNFIGQGAKPAEKMVDIDCKCSPTVLIVGDKADLDSSAYHLAQSLQFPFAAETIVTVLVAESVRKAFLDRLRPQLKAIPKEAVQHVERKKALALITKHNWETVSDNELGDNTPILVCDVTHEHLGSDYNGIVTLHTFRTIQESITLCGKESIKPVNASIWMSNHASAYEIALKIAADNIFIDCYQVPLEPLQKALPSSNVLVENNYHYEALVLKNGKRNIVFPIGTSISN